MIDRLILDMDGVMWHGNTPVPGLSDFFTTLQENNIDFVLATNNANKTVAQYLSKLGGLGVKVTADQIMTSAEVTGDYLSEHYEPGAPVYLVGGEGLYEAMRTRGFKIVSPAAVREGAAAAAVIMGLTLEVTYEQLAMATRLVSNGTPFIGTNPDVTYPSELGPMPGAGALQAVISTATGVYPLIIGKPSPVVFHEAVVRLGGRPETTAMVGDRLSTDIAGAKGAGLQAILVLSGISTAEEARAATHKPDYIFSDITELGQYLIHEQS